MADVITTQAPSAKRVEKSADRTHAWLRDASNGLRASQSSSVLPAIFAAIPPVGNVQQSLYLQDLAEDYRHLLSGLAVYSSISVADLPQSLIDLPCMCLSDQGSPHALLHDISLGVDLVCIPFVGSASDHGIAFTFDFPGPDFDTDVPQPLGIDFWSSGHEISLSPLSPGCDCFTCARHHRAYVSHLLQAKEMLAWTLLQVHNLSIMDRFFEACRRSIAKGTFEEDVKTFSRNYEAEMPAKTGSGPRIRGYQTKSIGGGEAKKNVKSWGRLDDAAQKMAEAESGIATPEGDSKQLEDQGFATKT
jgi:queuine tRNA-ribosyltransferase accessory subunit